MGKRKRPRKQLSIKELLRVRLSLFRCRNCSRPMNNPLTHTCRVGKAQAKRKAL
jgi:hypothetical protein